MTQMMLRSEPPFSSENPPEPEITPDLITRHGITPEEYEKIREILGREPSFTELGVFSVMWSEHCSYKNSKLELKKFPAGGPRMLIRAGEENAGVVDIGDGWAISFKIESHNHPSAVEPFQGAATGVGGIIRDIFTMGARPVFGLNSLRFGPISDPRGEISAERLKRNQQLFRGVVAGISHYGNCVGVPTIGGEVYFDESYEGNPLVNVFCLGVLRHEEIRRGAAEGVGNAVFYVGAETGRDGLAGAAFASRELTEESKEDRPAVQVGDPFREKLLLEACLELFQGDAVAGVQDMGAAGLTCSTCETASRAGNGVEIELDLVPKREDGMTPYEILLSESQERMLIIVKQGREGEVERVFQKWELPYARLGEVTADGMMRVKQGGRTFVEIPARALADDAPLYAREFRAPLPRATVDEVWSGLPHLPIPEILPRLLADPVFASKNWVYRQYDHMVQTGTVLRPGADAAVFYLREANKYLAATTDCNGLYCLLDPREGARAAIAEAARNITCTGAVPLAVTDNLNFGNPYKPENFWQIREAVEGMAEACRVFETPVTGGNVSLYNENPAGAVDPTPVAGMVGLIEDEAHITPGVFQQKGDDVILLGPLGDEMGGSQYLLRLHGIKAGPPPAADLERQKQLLNVLREMIQGGLVRGAHDCAEGGLAVALAECCFADDESGDGACLGAEIDLASDDAPENAVLLFNETQGRIVISAKPEQTPEILELARRGGVPAQRLGRVWPEALIIHTARATYQWPVEELRRIWWESLARIMSGAAEQK